MPIKRYGMAVKLKKNKINFYKKNHAAVWPEILKELKKININNYSIFLKDDYLFGYLEYSGSNFEKDIEKMEKIPIVDKWNKLMVDCFIPFPGTVNNSSWEMMDDIFYMK